MTDHFLEIMLRDPIISRDGRPFGLDSGRRMKSLDWLLPSMVAGSVRSAIGKQAGGVFDPVTIAGLKSISIHGGFPCSGQQLFFPAAGDLVRSAKDESLHRFRPETLDPGEGTDLPYGLIPVTLNNDEGFKFDETLAWWSKSAMVEWLTTRNGVRTDFMSDGEHVFLKAPDKDERTHVAVDPNTFAAKDEMLFSTTGLVVDQQYSCQGVPTDMSLSARVNVDSCAHVGLNSGLQKLDALQPFGGERRLARFVRMTKSPNGPDGWDCPKAVKTALTSMDTISEGNRCVRMVLATPAIFRHGWRPDWLKECNGRLEGIPPSINGIGVTLRLVAVHTQRWQAVSGWSLELQGPKAVRRMVPAGGVYYFHVVKGNAADLPALWLEPMSDEGADRADGFGQALWG